MQTSDGIVISVHGNHALVKSGDELVRVFVRGRFKKGKRKERSPMVVGDRVTFAPDEGVDPPEGALESVADRKTELYRAHPRFPRQRQVMAANVDKLLITCGVDRLDDQLLTLDRLLIGAQMQNLTPVIVFNKVDLPDAPEYESLAEVYRAVGHPVLFVSAATGAGVDALRAELRDCVSVFAGQSGVGKSSLLNALDESLELRTGEVDRIGEGRHTTTTSRLVESCGGWVVDTPGVRDFPFWDLELSELSLFYPDFAEHRVGCKYSACTHRHEPKCAVKDAVESGAIDKGRYQRYLTIMREEWNEENALKP